MKLNPDRKFGVEPGKRLAVNIDNYPATLEDVGPKCNVLYSLDLVDTAEWRGGS